MAEWSKAAVLKTAGRKPRGFESYRLRHVRSGPSDPSIFYILDRGNFGGERAHRGPVGPEVGAAPWEAGEVTERLKVLAC